MRVVLDEGVMEQARRQSWRYGSLLAGLLRHPRVELLQYREVLPGEVSTSEGLERSLARGVIAVVPQEGTGLEHAVYYRRPGEDRSFIETGIFGGAARGDYDRADATYHGLGEHEAARRRRQDTVVLGAARAVHADLLVTDRPYLHTPRWPGARTISICSVADAVAQVSLFLRCRGEYIPWTEQNGFHLRYGRTVFMGTAVHALLPSYDEWSLLLAVAHFDRPDHDDHHVAESVAGRLRRCLVLRDEVIRLATLPPSEDNNEQLLLTFDAFLLFLMGAFDGTARIAHRALDLGAKEFSAGWQRDDWAAKVAKMAPELAGLVTSETEGGDLVKAIAGLRNSIHGAGIAAATTRRPGDLSSQRDEIAVRVPKRDADRLSTRLHSRGWTANWGVDFGNDDRLLIRPDEVSTHLVIQALPLLDAIMRLTPLGLLVPDDAVIHRQGVSPTDGSASDERRYSVCVQLGLRRG